MSIKKHIPNTLSSIRLAMGLALPVVFFNASLLISIIFYAIAEATDLVDGFLARRWKVQSKYGKVVDPIADKTLNGVALLLTSSIINPILFILAGLEALIATVSISRVNLCKKKLGFKSNKKGIKRIIEEFSLSTKAAAKLNVAFIGKVKSFALLFATASTMLVPLVPGLNLLSNLLIGLTATLQVATAGNYLYEYNKEIKNAKNLQNDAISDEHKPFISDEIKKLEYAKERLHTLSEKNDFDIKQIKTENVKTNESQKHIEDKIKKNEDLGTSRTLKK